MSIPQNIPEYEIGFTNFALLEKAKFCTPIWCNAAPPQLIPEKFFTFYYFSKIKNSQIWPKFSAKMCNSPEHQVSPELSRVDKTVQNSHEPFLGALGNILAENLA